MSSKDLIAKLVEKMRQAEGWQNSRGDYGFMGKLINEHGEDAVRRALMTFGRVAKLYPVEGLRGVLVNLIQEAKEKIEGEEMAKKQREFLVKKTSLQLKKLEGT